MPELVALIACERVIIDEQLKVPSLLVVIERVEVQIPEGSDVPPNVVVPKEWFVFTIWGKKAEEGSGHYKQVIEIVPPGPTPAARVQMEFDFEGRIHKLQNKVFGFPAGVQGVCWVRVWLESASGSVTEKRSYPIEISHIFVKPDIGNLTLIEAAKP
jgi:hypothetical protein